MNLQTYIATFISFLNGIVIPFMLGMAFLVFVINVFRFFILGGANPDSQEKAKQLAVYGVGAFVFIIIFWGVVNLLTSSFGLQLLGERESRCSDYQCPDGNNPGGSIGTQPGQPFVGGVDPRSPDVGSGPSFPSTPGATIGDAPTSPSMPGMSDQPFVTGVDPRSPDVGNAPDLPSLPAYDPVSEFTGVVGGVAQTVENTFPQIQQTILSTEFSAITDEGLSDAVRINLAKAFSDIGVIAQEEFNSILSAINTIRRQENQSEIPSNFAVADPVYVNNLTAYKMGVENSSAILKTYYTSNNPNSLAADVATNRLYNTNNFDLVAAMDDAYDEYVFLTGTDQGNIDREVFLDNFISATNVYIELTGENDGQPITKEDVTGG
jgi:hypothetical protein